jgi:predicted enzyme related to lactoylglutathione lyase
LVLHAIPTHIAESISISEPPEIREETPIKLFFPVASISQARAAAPALGGQVGPVEREWEFWCIRACDGYDPEGNVFQLRQNVP